MVRSLLFLALVAALYMGLNCAFGVAYWVMGPDALSGDEHSFARAFFFSVQTASTIGYGQVSPASLGANLLVTVQALVSLISFALVSGVVYARFSRPVADIVFRRRKLAIFVDGCFWHGCRQHGTSSKSNAKFWRDKIERNMAQDDGIER